MGSPAIIFCPRCGLQSDADALFCQQCGTNLTAVRVAASGSGFAPPPPPPENASSETRAVPPPYVSTAAALPQPVAADPMAYSRFAGFWVRFVAFLIDLFLVYVVVIPAAWILGFPIALAGRGVAMPARGIDIVSSITASALGLFANWLYEALLESSEKQATIGKLVMGLKVTDLNGDRISFARATGRHFSKIISGMTLLIGYIMAGVTARKQALHDMIAGTYVMYR